MVGGNEHMVGAPTVGAGGVGRRVGKRESESIFRRLRIKPPRVGQLQSAEDVDGGLSAVIIGLGVEQGNARR